MAAVLEYLVAEVLELAGNKAHDHGTTTILPRHIMLVIEGDDKLKFVSSSSFVVGGCSSTYIMNLILQPVQTNAKKNNEEQTEIQLVTVAGITHNGRAGHCTCWQVQLWRRRPRIADANCQLVRQGVFKP